MWKPSFYLHHYGTIRRSSHFLFIFGIVLGWNINTLFSRHDRQQAATPGLTTPGTNISCNSQQLYPPPRECRSYHRCLFETIPYVSNMLETAQYLLYNQNKSFIRFGDGEVTLMNGKGMFFQVPNETLGIRLLEALTTYHETIEIGIPNVFHGPVQLSRAAQDWWYDKDYYRQFYLKHVNLSRQYFWASISAAYTTARNTTCHFLPLLYDTLRKIWEDQDIVLLRGDNHQQYEYDVYDTARSQMIFYAPYRQAWNDYAILHELLFKQDPSKLYILSCGPTCKVLAYDLAVSGRRALDMGHLAKDYDSYMSQKHYDDFFTD